MKELITKLSGIWGPAGNEEKIRATIEEEIRPLVDDVRVDALGNLIATKKGRGGKKVMLSAHMDEIGLIVTHIDDKGFLRFASVGFVSQAFALSQRVIFGSGRAGVIGSERLDDLKDLKLEKLYIDIGATSKEEARGLVRIGDTAVFQGLCFNLGNRIVGKALDDRIGCVILIEAARELKETPHEVHFVFTVQEEVGLRGARTAAYGLNPDIGIALDVTSVGDTPEARRMDIKLGGGVAIKVKDAGIISHPRVRSLLEEAAEKANIPYQLEVLEGGSTDAGAIHITREGVPSGALSIPCRYVHSPAEMVEMSDVQGAVDLLVKVLEGPIDV